MCGESVKEPREFLGDYCEHFQRDSCSYRDRCWNRHEKKPLWRQHIKCVTRQFKKCMFILNWGSEREEKEFNWWIEGLREWHETLTPCEHTEH